MNDGPVQRWLIDHTPLEPDLLTGPGFDRLIAERAAAAGCPDESAYASLLSRSPDELERLTSAVAVPETWLFRYPESFRHLEQALGQRLASGAPTLTMASLGCAGGEEPFSMAMTGRHAGWPAESIRIDAVDGSRAALARAALGVLGPGSIRTELPDWSARWLRPADGAVAVDPEIRGLIRFTHDDLTRPGALPAGPVYDIILCRNLLIYLNEAARARLVTAIAAALTPGGLLYVGHAEPLLWAGPGLRPVHAAHTFCLERADARIEPRASEGQPRRTPAPAARPVTRPPARAASPAPSLPGRAAAPAAPTIEDARDLADAGRFEECETVLRDLLARRGPGAEALELLGMVRMAARDEPGARACFERALYLEPDRAASLLQLAMIYERRGELRRAGVFWDRARRSQPTGEARS